MFVIGASDRQSIDDLSISLQKNWPFDIRFKTLEIQSLMTTNLIDFSNLNETVSLYLDDDMRKFLYNHYQLNTEAHEKYIFSYESKDQS
jgi:hypothetical protein